MKTSDHYFFRLSDPKCVEFLERMARHAGAAAAAGGQQGARVAHGLGRRGARRLGHFPRCSLLRHSDPGRARQIFLRLAGRPDRLSRLAAELLRYRQGARARRDIAPSRNFSRLPTPSRLHFIGKDIIYFHTLFWPAMLKFAGAPYKVPDHVYAHGFITVSGEKMSKSRGTGISPLRYLEIGMNPEWLRYYIAAKLNSNVEDLDFNPDDFVARVNSDLIGKYVNIASRCAGFITKRFAGKISRPHDAADALLRKLQSSEQSWAPIGRLYANREYGKAMREKCPICGSDQSGYRRAQAVGARQGSRRSDAKLQDVCSTRSRQVLVHARSC